MKSFSQFLLHEAKTKIKNDATKFEGDLIAAMGAPDPGSSNATWDPPDPNDPNVKLAQGIVEKMRANGISVSGARRASGGGGKGDLTKLYLEMGAKSGEPKTDIIFGRKNVSVKQADAAQLSAAQGPEFAAMIQAAVLHDPKVSRKSIALSKEAAKFVKQIAAPETFYKIRGGAIRPSELRARLKYQTGRGNLPDPVKKRLQNKEKKLSAADKDLNQMLGFSDTSPTKKQIRVLKGWAKQFGLDKEILAQLPAFFESEVVKKGLFLEAATGKYKFKKKTSIANYMFAWGTNPDSPGYAFETAQEFVDSIFAGGISSNFRMSDRGGVSSGKGFKEIQRRATDAEIIAMGRGGAWRMEVKKIPLHNNYMVDIDDETKEYITEMADEMAETHRTFLTENLEFAQEILLQEGLLDIAKGALKQGKVLLNTIKAKLKQGIDALVVKLREFFIKVGSWFARLARNVGIFMLAFDIHGDVKFRYNWLSV
ncbi:MAG TPA: hypothetical protein EYO99_00295 [Candidatus Marinimicrobia bacterium]|nr:hypothetical protein [Candidatus Neomarinimicrobiota bacterium]